MADDPTTPAPPIRIDATARTVDVDGQPVALKARAFDLLATLAGDMNHVFSPAELKAAVWPGRWIEDNNLRMQVQVLRQALGPGAVVNVPGRGYKLGIAVQLRRATRRTGNLPHWAGSLIGRENELAALQSLLAHHRLVSVTGPAGIGKTRLAQRRARLDEAQYPDGAWWVDLAAVPAGADDAPRVAQAIAQALRLQTAALVREGAAGALADALADWQALLLLDNAEHLAGDAGPLAALVRRLLEGAPGLVLLVTSQQRLMLPEEWGFRLGTLALPRVHDTPEQVRASPAVQLLVSRAEAADQAFELTDADLPQAAALVRRLDGIALAIEMAAAHLPVFGVGALLEHLSQRLQLLGAVGDAGLARHRTLRAALDWSHGLLSPAEQAALARLSVFAAPFRLDVGAHVVAAPGTDPTDALRAVQGLADKSLLQHEPAGPQGAPMRWRLLESTRLYADEALQRRGDGERDDAERRHVQALDALAQRARAELDVTADDAWSARWTPDHEDWMLAFDRAHAHGDADAAGRIIELLVVGANATGRVGPALSKARASRELAERARPLARARLLGWGSHLPPPGQTRTQAAALRVQAWRAVEAPERDAGLCTSLAMLAMLSEEAGDRAAADAALAECRALEAAHWPARLRRRCSWVALSRMAILREDAALRAEADALSRHLIAQLGRIGATRECRIVQAHVAQALRAQGRHLEAAAALQALAEAQLADGHELDAGLHLGIASAALVDAAGDDTSASSWPQAAAAARQALATLAPLPALMRYFLEPLALLACRLGDPLQAALLLAGADRLRRELQYTPHPMNTRAAARAQADIDALLCLPERALAEAQGRGVDHNALRLQALAWLEQRLAAAPQGPANAG